MEYTSSTFQHTQLIFCSHQMLAFKSFKTHFSKAYTKYMSKHPGRVVMADKLASLVAEAWPSSFTKVNITAFSPGFFEGILGITLFCKYIRRLFNTSSSETRVLLLTSARDRYGVKLLFLLWISWGIYYAFHTMKVPSPVDSIHRKADFH